MLITPVARARRERFALNESTASNLSIDFTLSGMLMTRTTKSGGKTSPALSGLDHFLGVGLSARRSAKSSSSQRLNMACRLYL